jgi:hypothetical protein
MVAIRSILEYYRNFYKSPSVLTLPYQLQGQYHQVAPLLPMSLTAPTQQCEPEPAKLNF